MADPYKKYPRTLESPATKHFTITPANGVDLAIRPKVLKVLTSGTLAIRDQNNVIIVYPVVSGEIIQFSAIGIESTNTTATVVGWY